MSDLRYGCILLAAGGSSRLGTPKQLALADGQPLVARSAGEALASRAWPVVVVLGAVAAQVRPALARLPVLMVENPAWSEGMASSIRTGLAALLQFSRALEAAAIAVADQPAFTGDCLDRLVAAQRATGRTMAAARYAGRNGPPALFLRRHFDSLAALTGENGARTLLNSGSDEVAAVEMPRLAFDIDTPEDLARIREASSP